MGIIIALLLGLAVGTIGAGLVIQRHYDAVLEKDIASIAGVNKRVQEETGFDFALLVVKLKGLSTKAQATFAYQYLHILDNKMLGTVRRYLDALERERDKPNKFKGQGKSL